MRKQSPGKILSSDDTTGHYMLVHSTEEELLLQMYVLKYFVFRLEETTSVQSMNQFMAYI